MFSRKKKDKEPHAAATAYIGCGGSTFQKYITKWTCREDGWIILECTNGETVEISPHTHCIIEYVRDN